MRVKHVNVRQRLKVCPVVVPLVGRERLLTCEHSEVTDCHLSYVTKYRTVEQHKCQGWLHHTPYQGRDQ